MFIHFLDHRNIAIITIFQNIIFSYFCHLNTIVYTVNVLTAPLHPRKLGKGPVVALGAAAFLLLAVLSKYLGSKNET